MRSRLEHVVEGEHSTHRRLVPELTGGGGGGHAAEAPAEAEEECGLEQSPCRGWASRQCPVSVPSAQGEARPVFSLSLRLGTA